MATSQFLHSIREAWPGGLWEVCRTSCSHGSDSFSGDRCLCGPSQEPMAAEPLQEMPRRYAPSPLPTPPLHLQVLRGNDDAGNPIDFDNGCHGYEQDEQDGAISRCYTTQQKRIFSQLKLPAAHSCNSPRYCSSEDGEHIHQDKLFETYQSFAMDLHSGMELKQLSHVTVQCHLLEDLATLTMDRGNGNVIEFPLANVTRICKLVNIGGKWRPADEVCSAPQSSEQQVVLTFNRRRLAFVFEDKSACEQFLTCLGLLIARARERQDAASSRVSLSPDDQAAGQELEAWLCQMCCVDDMGCLACSPSCGLLVANEHTGNVFACMGPPPDILRRSVDRSDDSSPHQRTPRTRRPRPKPVGKERGNTGSPFSPVSTAAPSSVSDTASTSVSR